MIRAIVFALVFALTASQAHAVLPEEMLKDPALEARAREISANLRCLVCQNQSIDDSNASLAQDLRIIVRERLVAGDTNAQAQDFIVSRYGNYVLLKPPFQGDTILLWLLPFALLIVALGTAYAYMRQRPEVEGDDTPNEILKSE